MGTLIHKSKRRGFTLLEVMIALAILSVTAIATIKAYNSSIEQQRSLEERTLALWIADNTLNKVRASRSWREYGAINNTTEFAARIWSLTIITSPTPIATIQKIIVTVSRQNISTSLTGYLGKF